jgi:ribA/ribD-fused uncharacterized protein
MKYSVDYIIDKVNKGDNLKYIFFWGHTLNKYGTVDKSCFSQWYDCYFNVDGVKYHTAEQYMMSQKAKLFNDNVNFQRIMNANYPNDFKRLGRQVKNFNMEIWEDNRYRLVVEGNLAKFSQNEDIKAYLLSTNHRILVEASPYDNIWGIGLSARDSQVNNPRLWNGLNLLGFALMEVRDTLST